jgi:hypothetical protein
MTAASGSALDPLTIVMRGLDPRIHPKKNSTWKMDCRVI